MTTWFRLARARPELFSIAIAALGLPLALDLAPAVKVLLVLIGFTGAAIAGPIAGFCLVGLALPLSSTVLAIGNTVWSPLELALMATGIAVGVALLADLGGQRTWAVFSRWVGPVDLVLIGSSLIVLASISLLWVADPDLRADSLRAFRRTILEPLVMIPATAVVVRQRSARTAVHWIVWPALATSLLAIGQLAVQHSTVDIGGISRPIGTFTHPNNLAFYLERVVWFCPLVALPLRRRHGRLVWGIVGIVLVATLLTLSRGAAVALIVGGTIMYWEEVRRHLRVFAGLMLAGVVLVFASRYVAQTGDSVDSRLDIWRGAIDMVRDHPVTGVGLDQFLGQYGRRYIHPEGWPERYTSHPHNVALDFWLSLGIAGIAILWLLIEASWRRFLHALKCAPWSFQRAGIALVAAGFAHGLIDNSFFLPYLATMTWLGLVLSGAPVEATVHE